MVYQRAEGAERAQSRVVAETRQLRREREMCLLTASEDGGCEDQRRVRAGMSMVATDSVGRSICGRSLQMISSGWQCLGSTTMHLSFVATVSCSTTYLCPPSKIFWVVSLQVGSAAQK
jgi:hypothetical protein